MRYDSRKQDCTLHKDRNFAAFSATALSTRSALINARSTKSRGHNAVYATTTRPVLNAAHGPELSLGGRLSRACVASWAPGGRRSGACVAPGCLDTARRPWGPRQGCRTGLVAHGAGAGCSGPVRGAHSGRGRRKRGPPLRPVLTLLPRGPSAPAGPHNACAWAACVPSPCSARGHVARLAETAEPSRDADDCVRPSAPQRGATVRERTRWLRVAAFRGRFS